MAYSPDHFLNTYLRRLVRLSGNSRMLFVPRARSEQLIDLHHLSHLNGEPSFSLVEAILKKKKKTVCSSVDSRLSAGNEAATRLKKLRRAERLIFEERGVRDLHIGWPFVRGKFLNGTRVRCPLLLLPVTLEEEKGRWTLAPKENAPIAFNKTFLLAYAFYNELHADEELLEETFEDLTLDPLAFRNALYERLKKSALDIHFNPDTYRDELAAFTPFLHADFDESHENGKLKLFPEALLGLFPQTGSYLAPDYLALMDNDKIKDVESLFVKKNDATVTPHNTSPQREKGEASIAEKSIFAGTAQDAWQENIVKAIKAGHSVVVSGPPGTGKSQLICNLVCDAVAANKKILVVCQKRAALDVVYRRLGQLDLSPFVALVHDVKHDRKKIYDKAKRQIDAIESYTEENNSLDTIRMERTFKQASHRIDQITNELSQLKEAFFDDKECGLAIKELYLRSDPTKPHIDLGKEYVHFRPDALDDFLHRLHTYAHYAARFEQPVYLLRQRRSFAALRAQDGTVIAEIMTQLPTALASLQERVQQVVGQSISLRQSKGLRAHHDALSLLTEQVCDPISYRYFCRHLTAGRIPSAAWPGELEKKAMDCFEEEGVETSLPTAQLTEADNALKKGLRNYRGPIRARLWKWFSADRPLVMRLLHHHALPEDLSGMRALEQKIRRRIQLEKCRSALKDPPTEYTKSAFSNWFDRQKRAAHGVRLFSAIRDATPVMDPLSMPFAAFAEKVQKLIAISVDMMALQAKMERYLMPEQIDALMQDPTPCKPLAKAVQKDFDALCEFDRLREQCTDTEVSVIKKAYDISRSWDNTENVILNSIYLAWIDHIEGRSPILRTVSSGRCALLEKELSARMAEKQRVGKAIMLMHARERITLDLEFNRLNNRVTYRDLRHQLAKKRRIWPLRKTMGVFDEDMFRLLPCWMASPEAVSALFPLKEMFDIVVFDEASQCFSEQGIPAVFRGRQLLVAGDDKQLPPNDLYRVRWKGEDENPDTEVDSLLALASRHLRTMPLRRHYRSRVAALIDFSNRHFYNGELQVIPHRDHLLSRDPPIVYRNVAGQWERQTNATEADEVAQIVWRQVQEDPEKEVGVVTFNAPQQTLVMDRVEERFAREGTPIPASLAVKNIENIQGDEKDIIVFSTAYAPDENGRVRLQFGSLNGAGGENRLNVAVTRAREQIIVVTSIEPHQLHVEDTQNEGPKLLKQYLQYAREVSAGRFVPFIKKGRSHPSSILLKDHVKEWGKKTGIGRSFSEEAFPFADLALMTDDGAQLLLTDDEQYHQSPSAKDFHVEIPLLLGDKRWSFLRLYSRNYWRNRNVFFEEIKRFAAEATTRHPST